MKEEEGLKKKTVLRAPPRSVELVSTLDTIKVHERIGEVKHYFYVRIILIITGLISIILGIYMLLNFNDYFEVDFDYRKLLLIFLYIYFPSGIGIFLLSLILSIFIYLFFWCCQKEKIHGAPLYDETDQSESIADFKTDDIDDGNKGKKRKADKKKLSGEREYIGVNADKVTLLPYTMTIFILISIAYSFLALPLSIFLLIKLYDDTEYRDLKEYWVLYIFIIANLINGILYVIVFFHMFLVKRKENSILKKNMELDENSIKNIRTEVRDALKKAK
jgi:hypothetical protein